MGIWGYADAYSMALTAFAAPPPENYPGRDSALVHGSAGTGTVHNLPGKHT